MAFNGGLLGLLFVLFLTATGWAQAPAGKFYALKVSPTAHSANVLLGDLIDGLPPEAVGKVIRPVGRPGSHLVLESAGIRVRLRQAIPGADLDAASPRTVEIIAPVQTLPGSTLRQFAETYLRERLSGSAGVTIEARGPVKDLALYDPPATLRVRPSSALDLRGMVVMGVQVEQADGQGRSRVTADVPVSFWVQRQETRLITQRMVRRGEAIVAEDVQAQEMDASRVPAGITSLDEAKGMRARQNIPAGKVLTQDLLELPEAIKRGDLIKLIVRSGAVLIETSAKALRSAKVGETLPVEMEGNKKQLQARCVADGVAVREAP